MSTHIARLVFVITIVIVIINRYAMIFYQHKILSCFRRQIVEHARSLASILKDLYLGWVGGDDQWAGGLLDRFLAFFPRVSKWIGDLSSGLLALLLTLWKDKHACAMCMCFARFVLKTTNEQVVSGVATYTLEGQTLHMSQVGRSPTFTGNCGMLLWACYKLCSKDYPLGRSGVFVFVVLFMYLSCV